MPSVANVSLCVLMFTVCQAKIFANARFFVEQDELKISSTVHGMRFVPKGPVYLWTDQEVSRFNGSAWERMDLPMTPEAADIDDDNRLWVIGNGSLAYLSEDETYHHVAPVPADSKWWDLYCYGKYIIAASEFMVWMYDVEEGVMREWVFEDDKRPLMHLVDGEVWLHRRGKGLFRLVKGDWEIALSGGYFASGAFYISKMYAKEGYFVATLNGSLYSWDGLSDPELLVRHENKLIVSGCSNGEGQHLVVDVDGSYAFFSESDMELEWYETAGQLNQIYSSVYVNGAYYMMGNGGVLRVDRQEGLSRIEIREGGVMKPVYAMHKKGDFLYCGTSSGLYVRDTEDVGAFELAADMRMLVGHIFALRDGLHLTGSKGVWRLEGDQLEPSFAYERNVSPAWLSRYKPGAYYLHTAPGLLRIHKDGSSLSINERLEVTGVHELGEDELLISAHPSGLYRYKKGECSQLSEDWSIISDVGGQPFQITMDGVRYYEGDYIVRFTQEMRPSVNTFYSVAWSEASEAMERWWAFPTSYGYAVLRVGTSEAERLEAEFLPLKYLETLGPLYAIHSNGKHLYVGGENGAMRYDRHALGATAPPEYAVPKLLVKGAEVGENTVRYSATQNATKMMIVHSGFSGASHVEYRLSEGDPWIKTENGMIHLARLPWRGSHLFIRVLGYGGFLHSSNEWRIFNPPPWYASYFAYGVYAFLLMFIAWVFYRWRIRIIKEHKEREALDYLHQEKDRFIAALGHELRNPLQGLLGVSRSLTSGDEHIGLLRRSAEHMRLQVEQMFDYAQLERGKAPVYEKVFDLSVLLRDTVALIQTQYDEGSRSWDLRVPDAFVVQTDASRLQQALFNVIGNAAKYSGYKGSVEVELRCEGGETVIRIIDSGPGVPKAEHMAIFERFKRGESASHHGLGIGLFLAKRQAMALGGSLDIEARKSGSCFRFQLPCPLLDEAVLEGVNEGSLMQVSGRCLVVDDNPLARQAAASLLQQIGMTVESFSDPSECMDKMRDGHVYDYAFVDFDMPEMNGSAFISQAKCINNDLICFALTGYTKAEVSEQLKSAGAKWVFEKPLMDDHLKQCFGSIVKQKISLKESVSRFSDAQRAQWQSAIEEAIVELEAFAKKGSLSRSDKHAIENYARLCASLTGEGNLKDIKDARGIKILLDILRRL